MSLQQLRVYFTLAAGMIMEKEARTTKKQEDPCPYAGY
jgi:hypothetical protein